MSGQTDAGSSLGWKLKWSHLWLYASLTCRCGSVRRVFFSNTGRLNCVVKNQTHQVKHTIRAYADFIIYLHKLCVCVGVCTPHRAGVHVWLAGDDGILVENIVSASSFWFDRCRLEIHFCPCFLETKEREQTM